MLQSPVRSREVCIKSVPHAPVKETPEITKVSLVHPDPDRGLDIPVNIILPGETNNRNFRKRNVPRIE